MTRRQSRRKNRHRDIYEKAGIGELCRLWWMPSRNSNLEIEHIYFISESRRTVMAFG